jgi:hypothetical protein
MKRKKREGGKRKTKKEWFSFIVAEHSDMVEFDSWVIHL